MGQEMKKPTNMLTKNFRKIIKNQIDMEKLDFNMKAMNLHHDVDMNNGIRPDIDTKKFIKPMCDDMEIVKNPNGPTIFKEIEENHENHINLTMKINMNHEGFMEKHIDLSIMKQRSWPNQLNFMMNDMEMGNFMNTAMNKLFENEKVMCNDNKPKPNTLNFMLHYEINQLFYRFPNYTQMVQHH